MPNGLSFESNPEYEAYSRSFESLLKALPSIDGWRPNITLLTLNEIRMSRFDAQESGELGPLVTVEERISESGRLLREYRFRFDQKRRELIREAVGKAIDAIDEVLRDATPDVERLSASVNQINTLPGSSVTRPSRRGDLRRHIRFGTEGDIHDFITYDWPSVKAGLRDALYGENEPIPSNVRDLGALVSSKPTGPVATKLKWDRLSDKEFERLLFALISSAPGYENPQWLTHTNAPDRGRDLSCERVSVDPLAGTERRRIIIQCKHWLTKSVGVSEVATLKEQMRL